MMPTNPYILGSSSVPADPWVPTDINGCVLWLRSDLGITMDESNRVGTWADQSGNGYNANQGTDANKFTWIDNTLNGYPVLYVDNTDDGMTFTGDPMIPNDSTIFVVSRFILDAAGFNTHISGSGGSLYVSSYSDVRGYFGGADYFRGTELVVEAWYYRIIYLNGTNSYIRRNGVDVTTNVSNIGTTTLGNSLMLGNNAGYSRGYGSQMAEFGVYSGVLSGNNLSLLETYLAGRYGL